MSSSHNGRRLFGRIGGTRRWVAVSSLLGIVTVGSGIGLVAMAAYLLTRSALLGSAASLSLTILGVRFFAVTRVVGRYCERYIGHLGTFRVLTRARVWLFTGLINSDVLARAGRRRGDVVTGLVDDVETMQDRLLRVSSPPLVAFGSLAIGVTALLAINATTAVILASAFLLEALALPSLLRARTASDAAGLVQLRAQRLAHATEYLDGLETLHVWGETNRFTDPLAEFDKSDAMFSHRLATGRALIDAAVIAITGICVLAVVVTIHSIDSTSAELWWLAATPLITLATFEALGPLLSVPEHKATTDAAAGRILELAAQTKRQTSSSTEAETPHSASVDNPSIELVDVSFAFSSDRSVLRHASLSIPFSTTVAIAAPSGSGKSTLLNLLLGALECDSGKLRVGGLDPTQRRTDDRPLIAAVLQDDHLFDTTVRDNLLVGDGEASDSRILEVCEIAGLSSFLARREGGLEAQVGPDGELLSGGERQRLMIARALLASAPILVLDEATEHLEASLRAQIMTNVFEARKGQTTVVLAHDVAAIANADIIYDLVDGRFVPR